MNHYILHHGTRQALTSQSDLRRHKVLLQLFGSNLHSGDLGTGEGWDLFPFQDFPALLAVAGAVGGRPNVAPGRSRGVRPVRAGAELEALKQIFSKLWTGHFLRQPSGHCRFHRGTSALDFAGALAL